MGEIQMICLGSRLGLLSFGAAFLFISSAQAHSVHADCRVGDSWMGVVPHYHPGAYGRAEACGGGGGGRRAAPGYGGGYYQQPAPPPPPADKYYGGGQHRGGDGYRYPQGTILGHGESVGCAASFSRIVEGSASVCRELR